MPRLHTRNRAGAINTTFHVFNRGQGKQRIFLDNADRREFIQCFRRHLASGRFTDAWGRQFADHRGVVEALAFCLMANHFHLVLHQLSPNGIADLMRSAMAGYVKYFNARHGRAGPLFSGEYRTVPKHDLFEIQTAIAYVHLNPTDGPDYDFSSHRAYMGQSEQPDWINIDKGLAVFGTRERYAQFVEAKQRAV